MTVMTVTIMIMAMVSQDMSDSVAQLAFKTWANLGICVCVCAKFPLSLL